MSIDKSLLAGSTSLLILLLLSEEDMYGYQMIARLRERSNDTFALKAGTLYPLLHTLEKQKLVQSYEQADEGPRLRKYYHLTKAGHAKLSEKTKEWQVFSKSVNRVLKGGGANAFT